MYCFDTDVLSATMRRESDLALVRPLAEPDARIAAIALARGLTLVTANVRHFDLE